MLWAGYLCPLTANVFEVEFLEFRIREMEGQKRELYHVKKPDDAVRRPTCLSSAGWCAGALRVPVLTVLARAPSSHRTPTRRTFRQSWRTSTV